MAKNSVVQESTKKKKSNIRKREHSNWNGYVFMAPYAIIFIVFILVPVLLAVVLSFTNFNSIEFPKFTGFLNWMRSSTSCSGSRRWI